MINRKITASQIKNLFRKSAKEYHEKFYKKEIKRKKFSPKPDYPFVCWNESDLRTYIIHYFFNKIEEKQIGYVHSEFQIKKNQFKENKTINEKWNAAVGEILKFKNRKRGGGDIDIAITDVDDGKDNLFLLCVEIKYFHYSLEAHRKDVEEELKKAYETLKILKEKGVTEEILMVIGNTYYKEDNQRSMKPKEIEAIKKFISEHEDDVVYLEM